MGASAVRMSTTLSKAVDGAQEFHNHLFLNLLLEVGHRDEDALIRFGVLFSDFDE